MIDNSRLVVLVDGSSYLFRAFHGLPPLKNRNGHPTGALHGVIKMLAKLYDDYQPYYFAVIFDAKGKTFRNDLYPDYKANRPPMDEDLSCQIKPLQDLIRALGFSLIIEPGVEADDVIGTLAKRALAENYQVVISSGDKDMAQLLTHADITLLDTMKNEVTTVNDIAKRFKVDALNADQVIDFLALVGDSADNIPGVNKVGPKTASKWLVKYGSVDNIINNATKITGKVGDNLRAGIDQLKLSEDLATIRCNLDLDSHIADLALQKRNPYKIESLCDTYELHGIKQKFLSDEVANEAPQQIVARNYHLVNSQADFESLLEKLSEQLIFTIDTETNSLDYMKADLVGISIAFEAGEAFYLPLAHQNAVNLPFDATLEQLKPILENPDIVKVGQNLKYDRHVFLRYQIALAGICEDTMIMSYCYNSNATRHNMDALADYYLNAKTTSFEAIAGKGAKQVTFDQIDLSIASDYACEDADITCQLYDFFRKKLSGVEKLNNLYEKLERPFVEVLLDMEQQGVKIDVERLNSQSDEITALCSALEKKAYEIAGKEFNLASTKQLQEILFDTLQLPVIRKTPKGQPSTNEDVLQELVNVHDAALPKVILDYRGLAKLKSTYTDKLPELVNQETGRIHTSYHQAVTSTGRLSSSDPNLQNIPIRSAEGRKIRQAFIAESGYQILAADYSQIELRIMAHLSGDESLTNAFRNNKDIHKATASEIFGVPLDQVDRDQRRHAKAINFGLIYGMSAFGLSKQLGISRKAAAEYIEIYFKRYPKVAAYMEAARETAKRQGYVETLLGRRLYVADINSKNSIRRNAAERLSINAPMQGSAADIIKQAMLNIHKKIKNDARCKLIMQVHDELVFEVRDDSLDVIKKLVVDEMENACSLNVPLIVDANVGDNWDEAH